jgi:hypothetical protein
LRRDHALAPSKRHSTASKQNLLGDASSLGLCAAEASEALHTIERTVAENWEDCLVLQGLDAAAIAHIAPCFAGVPDAAPGLR